MDSDLDNRTKSRAPSELLGLLPRKVKIYSTDGRYALAVAVITILGPVIWLGQYCFSDIKQMQQRSLLRSDGREVIGEVTGLIVERGGVSSAKYTFAANGLTYSGEARMPSHFGTVLDQTDKIIIRFLPANPDVNHPSAWEWSAWMGLDKALFSLFFIAMGSVAMTMLGRERKLAREGTVVAAIVKSCAPKASQFQTEYDFCVDDGKRMTGRSTSKESYEVGENVWILYLVARPSRNQLYPLSMYKIVE
jgi:hypothetical protein